jgi:subtilisin family serine protease
MLVVMERGELKTRMKTLKDRVGLRLATTSDFRSKAPNVGKIKDGEGLYLEHLGIAIVHQDPEQHRALCAAHSDSAQPVEYLEPERYVYALSGDYLRGFRDGVDDLAERLLGDGELAAARRPGRPGVMSEHFTDGQFTWGLQATRVDRTRFTGAGVHVAVLDTGLDLAHPDFAGRDVTIASFTGEPFGDGQGHGTHCIGTALGPRLPAGGPPRYGIASEAAIYAGKVLDNEGFGDDGGILAGIDWALENRCEIISMSLGSPASEGETYSRTYEKAARRAFKQGAIIVAAAGNESARPSFIAPVGHPANCPSILAVAALDSSLAIAEFSCGSTPDDGGGIDLAAPGVAVISSVPDGGTLPSDGTSMATPHVAGLAALWAQAVPDVRGRGLAQLLFSNARRLDLSSRDAGIGLGQAP